MRLWQLLPCRPCCVHTQPPSCPASHLPHCRHRFPERLRAVYLLDAGPLFRSLWYLIEPFIDA